MNGRIDINPESPLDARGLEILGKYRDELAKLTPEQICELITHMHIATERLIAKVREMERKLDMTTSITKVYGKNGKN